MKNLLPLANVRRARIDEAAFIRELLSANKDCIGLKEKIDELQEIPKYIKLFEEQCNEQEWFVIDVNNLIAGAMLLEKEAKLGGNEITYLVVSSYHARKGIATKLIRHAQNLYSALWAKTKPDNNRMIGCFQKSGFKQSNDHIKNSDASRKAYSWNCE